MKSITRFFPYLGVAMITLLVGVAANSAFGQDMDKMKEKVEKIKADAEKMKEKIGKVEYKEYKEGFCNNNNWSSDSKVSFSELREMTVSAGSLSVDGRMNGGISVKGEDRNDVLIRACVQTWGTSDESARSLASSIRISTGPTVRADGGEENGWSVSYDIRVPRRTDLDLKAHNGGISISNVEGNANFETLNGGVNLSGVSGGYKGRTQNGGVNVSLTGTSWRGSGLEVATMNGGVHVSMPENFAAHVESSTVNGGFSSDIPSLQIEKPADNNYGRRTPPRLNTDINGGGPTIRLTTTNGGVRFSSTSGERKTL